MAGAADDRCPRCGQRFACGVAGPGPCACTTITLSPALQARMRENWSGCLCLRCLSQLAQEDGPAPPGEGAGGASAGPAKACG